MTPTPDTTARTEKAGETVTVPRTLLANLAGIVRTQNGNLHSDINRLLADAEAALASPQHPVGVREAGPVAWRWRYYDGGPERPWYVRQSPVAPEEPSPGNAGVEVQPLYAHPPAQDAPGAEVGPQGMTMKEAEALIEEMRLTIKGYEERDRIAALDPSPPLPEADGEVVASVFRAGISGTTRINLVEGANVDVADGPVALVRQSALVSALRERDEARAEAERVIQSEIDRGPAPLRRLGEWLGNVLDGDQFPTAERMLLGGIAEANRAEAAREKAEQVAAGLREALVPFSLVAESDIGADEADTDAYRPMGDKYRRGPRITVGHFRRALAALRASTEEGKTATPSVKDEEAGR